MKISTSKILLTITLATVFFLSLTSTTEARPAPETDDLSNMVEALRVLEQYDKMYSQLARPRFGRSLRLGANDDSVNEGLRRDLPVTDESHR